MNTDKTTELEDAISFGQTVPGDEEDEADTTEDDHDPNAQGISNRPGDVDPGEGIDPEPGNNA